MRRARGARGRARRGRARRRGCGGGGRTRRRRRPCSARRPSVEVLQQAGEREGGFDPRGDLRARRAGRGDGHRDRAWRRRAAATRPGLGSGFVDLRRRARSRPTRTSSPAARAPTSARPSRSTCASPTATRCPAEVKGFDPFADVALLKIDPTGLTLRPLPLGSTQATCTSARPWPRSAARSARSSRSRSASSRRWTARSSRSPASPPSARSRPTRRSTTATPAARCSTRAARVLGINAQIQTDDRRRRGRRLRGAGRHRQRARWTSCAATGARATPTSAWRASPSTRSSPSASTCRSTRGAWVQDVTAGGPAEDAGLQGRRAARSASRSAPYRTGGDVVTAVAGRAGPRRERPGQALLELRARATR